MDEFYPMPSFPTLAVRDLEASLRWYCEGLGFTLVFTMPGPAGAALAHLRWAKYADLMLRSGLRAEGQPGLGVTLTFAVGDDLDALAARARRHGAIFVREPEDRPWNARDFTVADPDGYNLTFTKGPLDIDLTIDEVAARVRG